MKLFLIILSCLGALILLRILLTVLRSKKIKTDDLISLLNVSEAQRITHLENMGFRLTQGMSFGRWNPLQMIRFSRTFPKYDIILFDHESQRIREYNNSIPRDSGLSRIHQKKFYIQYGLRDDHYRAGNMILLLLRVGKYFLSSNRKFVNTPDSIADEFLNGIIKSGFTKEADPDFVREGFGWKEITKADDSSLYHYLDLRHYSMYRNEEYGIIVEEEYNKLNKPYTFFYLFHLHRESDTGM